VSSDGTTWTPVASGVGSSAKVTVSFAAQTARYLRLVQTGSSSSWWSIAEFNVLSASATTTPPAGTPVALPRSGWVASASPSSGDGPANAVDGNAATRFSSGSPMTNGQTFTLDLGSARTFDQLAMDSGGSAQDFARVFTVQVSADGVTWSNVTTGTGTSAVVTARFPHQTARWVRVVQNGSNSSWWSIAELNLYAG
jgi:beta-glucosidase